MKLVTGLLTLLIRLYQWTVRPFLGPCCRFTPSCSEYAVEALRLHGAARGTWLASRRVLRCNPWCQSGYDPVPAPICGCAASKKGFRAS